MDILSHGMWGGAAFYKKHGFKFWLAFFFGVFPDLFAFTAQFIRLFFGAESHVFGKPAIGQISPLTFDLYNISHSLVVFAVVFGIVALIRKKPLWEMAAWGLHILFDIPTHTDAFFPTPFLWPLSTFHLSGISWGQSWFMILNWSAILVTYAILWTRKRKKS